MIRQASWKAAASKRYRRRQRRWNAYLHAGPRFQVTHNVKNRKRGSLIEWTLTATPEGAMASSQSAAVVDMALLAWVDLDSSDDDDPLATQAADELALMMMG